MEQIGVVKNISNGKAEIEINRISGCGGGCSTCSGCDTPSHTLMLENTIDAKVGDSVKVKGQSKHFLKYTAIVYLFPLTMLLLGIFVSNIYLKNKGIVNFEIISFIVGLFTMGLSFIVVRIIDNKIAENGDDAISMIEIL